MLPYASSNRPCNTSICGQEPRVLVKTNSLPQRENKDERLCFPSSVEFMFYMRHDQDRSGWQHGTGGISDARMKGFTLCPSVIVTPDYLCDVLFRFSELLPFLPQVLVK